MYKQPVNPMMAAAGTGEKIFELGQLEVKLRIWRFRHELLRRPKGRIVGECDCGDGPVVENVRRFKRYTRVTLQCYDCGGVSELKVTRTRVIQTAIDTKIERGRFMLADTQASSLKRIFYALHRAKVNGERGDKEKAAVWGISIYRMGRRNVRLALMDHRHRLLGRPPGHIWRLCPCGGAMFVHTTTTTSNGKRRRVSVARCHDCGYRKPVSSLDTSRKRKSTRKASPRRKE
jgi:hypothetical protein